MLLSIEMDADPIADVKDTVVVRTKGAIDHKTITFFQQKLDDLQIAGNIRFIMDFTNVSYINSIGLGTLVNIADELETKNGGIVFFHLPVKIKIVFHMLELDSFFHIFPSENEAVCYLKSFVTQSSIATLINNRDSLLVSGEKMVPKLKKTFNKFIIKREWKKALFVIDKLISIDKNIFFYYKKASLFVKLKKYREAKKELETIILKQPDYQPAQRLLAKLRKWK